MISNETHYCNFFSHIFDSFIINILCRRFDMSIDSYYDDLSMPSEKKSNSILNGNEQIQVSLKASNIWISFKKIVFFISMFVGTPVNRIPIMAKQTLDLYELFRLVVSKGGLVEVINKKLWREITKGLNLPSSITSAAFTLRTQ